jgi:cytochrome c-type biogenesis protein CcmE
MTRKRKRMYIVLAGMLVVSAATALVLTAFDEGVTYFYSPSDLKAQAAPAGRSIRLGGLVEEDSVTRLEDGVSVRFRITDLSESVPVTYRGMLPDLFREGQGVITEGVLGPDGMFTAREVLAKHDETYMPPEVADALKESGQWRDPKETAQ